MKLIVEAKYCECDVLITIFFDEPDPSVGWNGHISVEEVIYEQIDVTQLLSRDTNGVIDAAHEGLKKWAKETGKKYWNIL